MAEELRPAKKATSSLSRPYTQGSFGRRLAQFEELIDEITLRDVEASSEQRRQLIAGRQLQ